MLLLDFEGGTLSIKSKCRKVEIEKLIEGKVKPQKDKIDVIRIREWGEFEQILDFLYEAGHPYRSVAIDSLTELNTANVRDVVEVAASASSKHDPELPEMQDYLRSAVQMRRIVRAFRDLPMNTIITCLADTRENPRTRRKQLVPSLTGKLVFEVPAIFDIVGYLGIVEEEGEPDRRELFVQPTEDMEAKDRSEGGALGESVPNPTLPLLFDLIGVK